MKKKLQNLLEELNHGLVERQEAVKLSLLAALAGEHMLLVGPPGTGKSMIARRISECFNNSGDGAENDYFEYLLTKFSTHEEIFGPLSISELKADRFKRNTSGYLPTVKVAFLDEIFKASSSILNALLTILNERIYHNGTERQKVPLQSLIAASNELPVGQDELNALYDRFLVRCFVDYVSADNLPKLFEHTNAEPIATCIGEDELESIRSAACAVVIPKIIQEAIQAIWMKHKEAFREDRREQLSDRRLKKVMQILRISAATNGRFAVDLSDLVVLKHCLWNSQENAKKVQDLVLKVLFQYGRGTYAGVENGSNYLAAQMVTQSDSVVEGYGGSGSPDDPFLVGNVDQLQGLARPEIGMQGYSFRQTADIDCSGVDSLGIECFSGSYDGFGYIISKSREKNEYPASSWNAVFKDVKNGSVIHNVALDGFNLTGNARGAIIRGCRTNWSIIAGCAYDCYVESCMAGDHIVMGLIVEGCTLSKCISTSYLVGRFHHTPGDAVACEIKDCFAYHTNAFGGNQDDNQFFSAGECGGLLRGVSVGSLIERCYVSGVVSHLSSGAVLAGIAHVCDKSQIKNCAVGHLSAGVLGVRVNPGIANVINGGVLSNNAAGWKLDLPDGEQDPNGPNGRNIENLDFRRKFFEETLGWDFDETWGWDDDMREPVMLPDFLGGTNVGAGMLTQKIKANIWL